MSDPQVRNCPVPGRPGYTRGLEEHEKPHRDNLPRLTIYGVDRSINGPLLPALIRSQNDNLGLTDEEAKGIKPMYKIGPREGLTVNWVVECPPYIFQKLEGISTYIGLTKCKMKLYNRTPQCFVCQKFGHTSKTCRSDQPICRNCAGNHDSRSCNSDQVKCANCRLNSHKANSKNCSSKTAAERTPKRTLPRALNKNE